MLYHGLGAEAIEWISKAFTDESALLKHELAYCLGQMQDRHAIPTLTAVLRDTQQEPMVRHEAGKNACAHKLGSAKRPITSKPQLHQTNTPTFI